MVNGSFEAMGSVLGGGCLRVCAPARQKNPAETRG
jgi:hypothetical protein